MLVVMVWMGVMWFKKTVRIEQLSSEEMKRLMEIQVRYAEVESYRPVSFSDSKTQPFTLAVVS